MLDGMDDPFLEPWIPPGLPDLASLAMAAADAEGVANLRAWPERRKGGIGFGDLPPFLCWRGRAENHWQLVLLQPRELGALIPGAHPAAMAKDWLEAMDLDALGRPLARHPDFPGGASIQVVQVPRRGVFRVRTYGAAAPKLVAEVLSRITSCQVWHPAH
jgi:hypothetical protein